MGKYRTNKKNLFWVRGRIKEITPGEKEDGMRPYQETPRLRQASVAAIGGTVNATHAQKVQREFLGQSEGAPGQEYQLQMAPILPREEHECLIVQIEGETPQQWTEVNNFSTSGPNDRHYTLDSVTGALRFGPAVRQQDGTIKLYGAIPPRGANLIMEAYRFGGGEQGNVQARVLNTLKTAIPYIARVRNRSSAWGGLDAETLESAMMRAPALLRSRDRAVTEADFEYLARQALPAKIGRVKCIQPRPAEAGRVTPGQVFVLVVPRVPRPGAFLEPDQLNLEEGDVAALTDYLDERRMLTTRFDVRPPAYQWVSTKVLLRANPGVDQNVVEAEVLRRMYRFLNPLTGGLHNKGWPFGRDLFVSEVYQCLQGTPDVQFIRGVELYQAQPGGEAHGDPIETVELLAHGVIASGIHTVEFV
jgi:predicted phage baseplate assembly protein